MSFIPYRLNILSLRRTHSQTQLACLVAVEYLEVRNLLSGFSPQQVATAYNFTPTVTVDGQTFAADGAGQTIAIVDAFINPFIDQDLAAFDQFYGLPAPPSFTKLSLVTTPPGTNADTAGWAGETAL